MQLFILRHGHAESQQTTDDARNLTEKGRKDVTHSVKASLMDLAQVQEIWASPLVRAQQTAEIAQYLLAQSGNDLAIKTVDALVPEAIPESLFSVLENANVNSILLVGHQPFVGEFMDDLCGTETGAHPFDTSTLACVACEFPASGMGTLGWLRHVHG